MIVGINCGHTKTGPGSGAVGLINESDETRNVGYKLIKKLNERGVSTVDCTVDKASSQAQYLAKTVELANKQHLDLFISLHFNAGGGRGVEVFTYNSRKLDEASKVCKNLNSLGFINRGIKDGSNLYVVRKSRAKAILIEVCFVDSNDAELYLKLGADKIASAIADAICKDSDKENNNSPNSGGPNNKEEYDMNKIVLYFGDVDLFASVMVAQRNRCPLMKKSDFDASALKAKEIIQVGGKKEDEDRFVTFKNAAKLL